MYLVNQSFKLKWNEVFEDNLQSTPVVYICTGYFSRFRFFFILIPSRAQSLDIIDANCNAIVVSGLVRVQISIQKKDYARII